jgi:hypothetical protein
LALGQPAIGFALDFWTPFCIVYPDGRVMVAQLADVDIQSKEILLRYRTVDGDTEKLVEVAIPHGEGG